jgi:hypothetical protein
MAGDGALTWSGGMTNGRRAMLLHEADDETVLNWICEVARAAVAELEALSFETGKPVAEILEDFEERRQRGFGPPDVAGMRGRATR